MSGNARAKKPIKQQGCQTKATATFGDSIRFIAATGVLRE
jgi:hypothetical protein